MNDAAVVVPPLRRPEFRNLLGISITVALGFGMIIPVLPLYARSFGVGIALIGMVQLVFGATRFSFGLVSGVVVDLFGERACTIAGLLIVSASSFAAGLAQNFPQLVVARGVGGAGSALFIGGLMNRILRIIEPAAMGRATGAFRASFLVGIGLGPIFGGLVAEQLDSLSAPFHIYAAGLVVASAIAFVVMRGQTRETETQKKSIRGSLQAAAPLMKDQRYVVALLATFVGWWTISGPAQTVGPVYAETILGLSTQQIGVAVTMLAVGEILILMVAGRAADRYGRRAVLVPSLVCTAVATALLGFIDGAPWAYYPVMVAIGAGIAAGGAAAGGLLADAIPEGGSGAAVGVNQMAGDVGYLIAPLALGGVAQGISFRAAYVIGAIPAALVLIPTVRLRRGAPSSRRGEAMPEPSALG